jgi:uncharacterized membrane protein
VEVFSSRPLSLNDSLSHLAFSFAAEWLEQPPTDSAFFFHKFHFYAVWQMFFECVIVYGFIVFVYRQLVSDSASPAGFDDFDRQRSVERGWKMIHADVFRSPEFPRALAVLAGAGLHAAVAALCFCFVKMAVPVDQPPRFSATLAVVVFVVSAGFAGFSAVAYANSFGIRHWSKLALVAVLLVPIALALFRGAVSLFAFGFFFGLLTLVEIVLSVAGGAVAHRQQLFSEVPCPVAAIPRGIPPLPLSAKAPFLSLLIGFFAIAPVAVELFFVLTAFWRSETYCACGFLFPTVLLLCANIGGLTILAVTVRFQRECHRWQWFSFLAPAGCGAWLFGCCVWFYVWRVESLGWATTAYFLWTAGLSCAFVALAAGGIGFFAANCFVRLTFSNLKLD